MREYFSLYPRTLPLSAGAAILLGVMAIVSAISAAVPKSSEIAQSKNENSRKLAAGECRLDQHARTPYCKVQGRTVRVIGF